ncbi:hypothetical protein ASPACDRAFT_46890 [Aspergillus aculeatus ATCC 16872]|uniref:gamma-glutamylcyclotransferase n=1 Tax=Aspergillus aculeatus (strain ATCC 16872 / CBS 172.66 / WB 5094) TaxID=690307 RepID=A0A1L9WIX5_ASPA1|nr:uncharacterized protein ASPACDRAFT_46890 [Aspergillus aculeatus ATCC 16872]OJJ96128.1 hypothetical protein ASPACDRAFT_46890 [Aspergillus aculeatus ATCC 16872]
MHLHDPPNLPTDPASTPINININISNINPTNPTTPPQQSHPRSERRRHRRPLYFAYGSNLSPSQMATRCVHSPASSVPLAIARLPHWRWLICEQGYANVLPPPEMRVGPQTGVQDEEVPVAGAEDAVYGVLYAMDERDERLLDGFEGVDWDAPAAVAPPALSVRPREQGQGDYNKWVVEAEVVQWLEGKSHDGGSGSGSTVPVLVYVDELRVKLGPPKEEYIPRMNRAIRESVALGLPEKWANEVMRPSIPRS